MIMGIVYTISILASSAASPRQCEVFRVRAYLLINPDMRQVVLEEKRQLQRLSDSLSGWGCCAWQKLHGRATNQVVGLRSLDTQSH